MFGLGVIAALKDVIIHGDQTWSTGTEVTVPAGVTVPFLGGGTLDFSDVTVTGLAFNTEDVTLTGLTTIDDDLVVNATSGFLGLAQFADQVWTGGSQITIPNTTTVELVGNGTLDMSGITVTGLAISTNNPTFTGSTTIQDTLVVSAASTFNGSATFANQTWANASQINVATTANFVGGGTVSFAGVNVSGLPPPSLNNSTLTGTTTVQTTLIVPAASNFSGVVTLDDQIWSAGSNISIGTSAAFVGGGTLDFAGVTVLNLPASTNNVTLTGTTTIQDNLVVPGVSNFTGSVSLANQVWGNASQISVASSAAFVGGGSLDFAGVTVLNLPIPTNNLTLTGTTTIQNSLVVSAATASFSGAVSLANQSWAPASNISVTGPVSFVGAGTLDFTGVNVAGLTFSTANLTLTGVTAIQDTLNVSASSAFTGNVTLANQSWGNASTITVATTAGFVGGGTLDFSNVTVTGLPAAPTNNLTLTGTTTLADQVWGAASDVTVATSASFIGGGTVDFSGVTVTGISFPTANLTLSGTTAIGGPALNVTAPAVNYSAATTTTYAAGATVDFTGATVNGLNIPATETATFDLGAVSDDGWAAAPIPGGDPVTRFNAYRNGEIISITVNSGPGASSAFGITLTNNTGGPSATATWGGVVPVNFRPPTGSASMMALGPTSAIQQIRVYVQPSGAIQFVLPSDLPDAGTVDINNGCVFSYRLL